IAGKATAAVLPLVLVVNLAEDGDQGAGPELLGDGGDFAEPRRFTKGTDEAKALRVGPAEAGPLGDHDGPGHDAREKQNDEDSEGHGAAIVNHLQESAAVGCGRGCASGVFLRDV